MNTAADYRHSQTVACRPLQLQEAREYLAVAMEGLTPFQQMAVLAYASDMIDTELANAHGLTRKAVYEARMNGMACMRRTLRAFGIAGVDDVVDRI